MWNILLIHLVLIQNRTQNILDGMLIKSNVSKLFEGRQTGRTQQQQQKPKTKITTTSAEVRVTK